MKDLLTHLNLIIELVLDSGFAPPKEYRKIYREDFGGVSIYIAETQQFGGFSKGMYDTRFCSIEYRNISVKFYTEKISGIELEDLVLWGVDLSLWVNDAHQAVIEGIAQKVKRNNVELEDAKAGGN